MSNYRAQQLNVSSKRFKGYYIPATLYYNFKLVTFQAQAQNISYSISCQANVIGKEPDVTDCISQLIMKHLLTEWRLPLSLTLLALSSLLLWLWQSAPNRLPDIPISTTSKIESFPLYYMRNIKTIQYDADGNLAYQLEALKLDHYTGDGLTAKDRHANAYATMERPSMIFYDEKGYPWRLSAARGESRNDGEIIVFTGNVRFWQVKDDVVTTQLTSQSLAVRPGEKLAQTDKLVVAESIAGTIQSIGAKLFINSGKIELLSAVQGVYDRL